MYGFSAIVETYNETKISNFKTELGPERHISFSWIKRFILTVFQISTIA